MVQSSRRTLLLPWPALAAFALCFAGCSSNSAPTSGGAGVPASLTVVSGDGQSAAPGAALPVALSVVVKDAAGNAVAGTTVHFSVDSGGGSLVHGSAVTGSDGVASAGVWTLGSVSGTNVVSATVGTLPPIKFHAQAFGASARPLFSGAPVSASGGTLTYRHAGDPLDGLAITVPAAAYPVATQWTITADSTVVPTLPADFSQVGPTLVIGNSEGYSDSIMTLTMPLALDTATAVAPFYFDPVTGTLEPIPLVSRTTTSATLATSHFSADLMAIPGTAPTSASLRSAALRTFGNVRIVWITIPDAKLVGTFDSGFRVGVDNWEFVNYGDYIAPDGDCTGMSITEMYYYYFVTLGGKPSLYHHFDTSLANLWDNREGIRFAGSVQGDYLARLYSGLDQIGHLTQAAAANDVSLTSLTSSWIALTLKLTRRPVLIGLRNPTEGHTVVAYSATTVGSQTTVAFADPNFPTTLRNMVFVGGNATPVSLQTNATANADNYPLVYALGVTAEVPLRAIDARWKEFLNKSAGADRYPNDYTVRFRDSIDHSWTNSAFFPGGPIDTFRTTVPDFHPQFLCGSCGVSGFDPPAAQKMLIYDDSGAVRKDDGHDMSALMPGLQNPLLVAYAASLSENLKTNPDFGFIDSHSVPVIYRPFSIAPDTLFGSPGKPYTFAATDGGLSTPTSRYTWDFDDDTPLQAVTRDSSISHTFDLPGTYRVAVTLTNGAGVKIGTDTVPAIISTSAAWQVVEASAPVVSLPVVGIGPLAVDSAARDSVTQWLKNAQDNPDGSIIFYADSLSCHDISLEQFAGTPVLTKLVPDAQKVILGIAGGTPCFGTVQVTGTATIGALGAGALTGLITTTQTGIVTVLGAISATMNGLDLIGTLTVNVNYTTGLGTYTLPFKAEQVLPDPLARLRARRARAGP